MTSSLTPTLRKIWLDDSGDHLRTGPAFAYFLYPDHACTFSPAVYAVGWFAYLFAFGLFGLRLFTFFYSSFPLHILHHIPMQYDILQLMQDLIFIRHDFLHRFLDRDEGAFFEHIGHYVFVNLVLNKFDVFQD